MPKDKKPFERYQQIHDLFVLRRGANSVVSLKDLAERLGISFRQVNIDIKKMKEMDAPLEYVPALYGWRYSPGSNFTLVDKIPLTSQDVLLLRVAFETMTKTGQLRDFEEAKDAFGKIHKAVRKWTDPSAKAKHIYFDPLPKYEGSKYLTFFLKAIEESRRVEFQYKAFHAEQAKTVLFDPWFLRNYDRRWYVGGYSHDPSEGFVRAFPLERIADEPVIKGFFHDKPPQYDAETYWKNIYGITIPPDGKVEEVVLEFIAVQAKYFVSTPFFEPYRILEDTPQKLVVSMDLMPNIDLVRKLASFGADVRVLAPAALAHQVRDLHKKAWEQYL